MGRKVVRSIICFPCLCVDGELTKVEKETAESFPECYKRHLVLWLGLALMIKLPLVS